MPRSIVTIWLDRIIYWGLIVQIIALPLRHSDTVVLAAFALPLLALIARRVITRQKYGPTPMDLPLALFLAAALVSLLYSVDPAETIDEIRSDIIIPLATFYLAAWGLRSRSQLLGLGQAAVVVLGLLTGYGIIHFFAVGGQLSSYAYREASLSPDYHFLGTYLITAFPLALIVAVSHPRRIWLWAGRAVALSVPLGVYITFDRGCWLALVFMGLALYPLFIQRLGIYLVGLGLAVAALLVVTPTGVLIHGQKIGVYTGEEIEANTFSQRALVWSYCLDGIRAKPLSGIGYGRHNFKKAFPEFWQHYQRWQLWHCHNTYLDLAIQMGLLGLAAFAFLMVTALRMAYGIWRRAGPGRLWGAAGVLCVGALLVRIFWDSFYIDEHIRLLWLFLGAIWAASRMEEA